MTFKNSISSERHNEYEARFSAGSASGIPIFALGWSFGFFFALIYTLGVVFDLWFPEYAMRSVWAPLLPGFKWITWPSFFLGLLLTVIYGWVFALGYGPIYNFISRKIARG